MYYHSMMSSVIIIVNEGSLKNAEEELTFDGFVLKLGQTLTFAFKSSPKSAQTQK